MNSKILGMALVTCCIAGFTSCDDDIDNPYARVSSVSIVSCDVDFDACADQGVVHFSAPGTVTVTPTVDWCTAEVNADSVVVKVTQNCSVSGRATQLVLRCGSDTATVSVTQMGVRVIKDFTGIGVETDEAYENAYPITSNVVLSVLSSSDWVEASIADDTLHLSVQANNTGALRIGELVIGSETYTDTIRVVQADYSTDIEGSYRLYYYNSSGTLRNISATISGTTLTVMGYNIAIDFDYESGEFSVECGQYVGMSESFNYVYLVFATQVLDDLSYYWTGYNTGYYMTAPVVVAEDGSFTAEFSGNLVGYTLERFLFRCFTSNDLSSDSDASENTMELTSPYLYRAAASN